MPDRVNVHVPLFDRLLSEGTGTLGDMAGPHRSFGRHDLIESVRRELERLFNTRCSLPAHELDERERTVLDYGLPDFSHLSPLRGEDRERLIASLKQAIRAYEPRLCDVEVVVGKFTRETQSFELRIDAVLVVDNVRESVSFRSVLPANQGKAEVHARDESR